MVQTPIFPAGAGVILEVAKNRQGGNDLSRRCGGDPRGTRKNRPKFLSFPQMLKVALNDKVDYSEVFLKFIEIRCYFE